MIPGPPTHLRVRLGIELREARHAAGLTQVEAARLVGRSQAWLNKIENSGIVRVKLPDLDRMIEVYGIPTEVADYLRKIVRSPYDERGIWVDTSSAPAWWSKYQEVELKARVIKAVHLEAHDGLIQSEAYMRRQFELDGEVDSERQVRARLARQRAVLEQDCPPDCTFVLSQACLHRNMGDPAMMADQLAHLLALTMRPNVTILVLPFDARIPAQPYGFTFLQFNSTTMGDFVNIEYAVGSATIDEEDALRVFQRRWEQVRSEALGEYDSRQLIRRVLDEHRNE